MDPAYGGELRYLLEKCAQPESGGLARHVGVNGRTVRRWVNGEKRHRVFRLVHPL